LVSVLASFAPLVAVPSTVPWRVDAPRLLSRLAPCVPLAAVGVLFDGGEVVLRDATAADKGEADLAVGDRGGVMHF
jgi:hypothetical protein